MITCNYEVWLANDLKGSSIFAIFVYHFISQTPLANKPVAFDLSLSLQKNTKSIQHRISFQFSFARDYECWISINFISYLKNSSMILFVSWIFPKERQLLESILYQCVTSYKKEWRFSYFGKDSLILLSFPTNLTKIIMNR